MQKAKWQARDSAGDVLWQEEPPTSSGFGNDTSLGKVAWQWKGSILLGSVLAALIAYVALLQVTPVYEAKTQVILGSGSSPVINIPNVVPETNANVGYTASALVVLKSTDLLRTVVESLELDKLAEYNPALREPGLLDQAKARIRPFFGAGDDASDAIASDTYLPYNADDPLSGTLRGLRSAVSVKVIGESQVVEIAARSSNPRLAALISDTIAETFISRQLEAKILAGGQATGWLEERAEQLREELGQSEQNVAEFRSRIVNSGKYLSADAALRIESMTAQMAELSAKQADMIDRRDEIQKLLSDGNYIALTEVLALPAVTELYERLITLENRVIDLQEQFGEHPGVIDAREKRDVVKERLVEQVGLALSGLNVRINVATDRLAAFEEQLQSSRRDLSELRQDELKLLELEREAEASRDVYNRFLLRLKEARERSLFQTPEASIVSFAEVPIVPAWPQKTKLAAIAGFGGGLLVLALILLTGLYSMRVRDPRDVAALTGVAAVYQVPYVSGIRNPAQLLPRLRKSADTALAGCVHWLRLRLTPKTPNRSTVIVVTSPGRNEGKSALSVMLAEAFDINGYSTALVNADPDRGGLSLLEEANEFKESSFRFFDFSDDAMRILEQQASSDIDVRDRLKTLNQADVIIIDGPTALTSPEIVEIGALADHVVLACAWNQTTTQRLVQCVELLRDSGLHISAIAINKVPQKLIRIAKPPTPVKRQVPALMPPSA